MWWKTSKCHDISKTDYFHSFLENIKKHVRTLHSSHMALKNFEFFRENEIVLLTLSSHCTHKLQPMNRAVFGTLTRAINIPSDNWICDIPFVVKFFLCGDQSK